MISNRRQCIPDHVTWRKSTVTQTIETIVASVILQAESGDNWWKHPAEDVNSDRLSDFFVSRGEALWVVDYLQRSGAVKTKFDVSVSLDGLFNDNRHLRSDLVSSERYSDLFGELFLLLMQYRLKPSGTIANQIEKTIKNSDTLPVEERKRGLAGSMLVVLAMYRWTDEPRWMNAYKALAKHMLSDWTCIRGIGYVWGEEFYHTQMSSLGPGSGFSGNAWALIKGFDLHTDEQNRTITDRIMDTAIRNALHDGQHACWPPQYTSLSLNLDNRTLIESWHGAPPMIIPLATLPQGMNADFDSLVLKGGELIWDAGLLQKGPGLCQANRDNGYALLKLFQRTGDEIWLERARMYAMHCIEQYNERMSR